MSLGPNSALDFSGTSWSDVPSWAFIFKSTPIGFLLIFFLRYFLEHSNGFQLTRTNSLSSFSSFAASQLKQISFIFTKYYTALYDLLRRLIYVPLTQSLFFSNLCRRSRLRDGSAPLRSALATAGSFNPTGDVAKSRLPIPHPLNNPLHILPCNSWSWGADRAHHELQQERRRCRHRNHEGRQNLSLPGGSVNPFPLKLQLMPGSTTVQLLSHTAPKMSSTPHQDRPPPLHRRTLPHKWSHYPLLRNLEALPE